MSANNEEFFTVTQKDSYLTKVFPYYTEKPDRKGSVVILHGMAEHHARYDNFARFLNTEGFDVFLYDHRGHGVDKAAEDLGFFADRDGDKLVIRDAIGVLRHVKKTNRADKLILFGHSMGSLIARNVIQHYDEMDCAVICGTTMPALPVSLAGSVIASALCLLKGPRSRAPIMDRLLFSGGLYKKICTRTTNDWLTRDEAVVSAYNNDPFCGFLCTSSFYRDLIRLTLTAGKRELISKTRKDLPLLLISGDKDPVGGFGKQVGGLYRTFQKLEFSNVTLKLYPECRHELLNERNKEDIMKDIASWIREQI